jgi:hypothetical protein
VSEEVDVHTVEPQVWRHGLVLHFEGSQMSLRTGEVSRGVSMSCAAWMTACSRTSESPAATSSAWFAMAAGRLECRRPGEICQAESSRCPVDIRVEAHSRKWSPRNYSPLAAG